MLWNMSKDPKNVRIPWDFNGSAQWFKSFQACNVSDGFFCYIDYANFYQVLFESFQSIVELEMWVVRLNYIILLAECVVI